MTLEIIKTAYAAPVDLGNQYGFGNVGSASDLVGRLTVPAFTIAGIALIFYVVFGAVRFMTSGGDKTAVAEARGMIMHAVVGFLLLMVMFIILKYIPEALDLNMQIIQ